MSAPAPTSAKEAPPFKTRLIGLLAYSAIRLLCRTLRLRIEDPAGFLSGDPGPVIWCFWHNSILVLPVVYLRRTRKRRRAAVLTSASRDGAVLAETMRRFAIDAVRGSSSRRGAQALLECRRVLSQGKDLAITPDGPRGPCHRVAPGVAQLARVTGFPVLPVKVRFKNAWRLKSWDRFQIPKPFSVVTVCFLPLERIGDDMESGRAALERLLQPDENP